MLEVIFLFVLKVMFKSMKQTRISEAIFTDFFITWDTKIKHLVKKRLNPMTFIFISAIFAPEICSLNIVEVLSLFLNHRFTKG